MKVPINSRWHHRKRGTDYKVVGEVRLNYAEVVPRDGDMLVLYLGNDGVYSARHPDEFLDGRFMRIRPE